jgi:hypothetical protein
MDESLASAKFMTAEQTKTLREQLEREQLQEEIRETDEELEKEYRR